MINSSEYTCALISLPGGSKSNFFIPLVRKIKPQILNNNKNDCKNYKTEEDIEKLYKKYTSLTPVSRMSEQ